MRNIILAFLLTGCAHHPFAKEWEWSATQPGTSVTDNFEWSKKKAQEGRAQYPEMYKRWDKATLGEGPVIDVYDSNGKLVNTFQGR